jgi:polysaccharide export outer membrane protein
VGGQRATAKPEQSTSAVPPSETLSSSDMTPPSTSDLARATETEPANPRSMVSPPTSNALKNSQMKNGAKRQKTKFPSGLSGPNPVNTYSPPNKEGLSASAALDAPSDPLRATSGNASTKATDFSEVPPAKPSEPSRNKVPDSNFLSQLDDIGKKPTVIRSSAPPPGTTTNDLPGADGKPVADMKTAGSPHPPPVPSKSVLPSENSEPPEKKVSMQASAAKIPHAVETRSSSAGQAGSSSSSQYRIGPEDVLNVSVWGDKEMTMDVIVRPDGKISLPLVQDILAEGLTASELADTIHQKLLPFIKDPNVSVIVKQINSPKFSVMGYVSRPGTFPLRGDVTVLEALSMAGGFTPFASPRKIKLVRNADGKQDIRVVNYYDMIDKGGEGNYLLKAGDIIVVP